MNTTILGTRSLVKLGLSPIEAEVYLTLLQQGTGTGYAVANVMGRQPPQIYKALENLSLKGAVMLDDSQTKRWTAVEPSTFLNQLERGFREDLTDAERELEGLQVVRDPDAIYRLHTVAQVIEHCRSLLGEAQKIAILDIFPGPARELGEAIKAAVERGVHVRASVYAPFSVPGVEVALASRADEVLDEFHGQVVSCVADARAFLSAVLTKDGEGVQTAIASRDPLLAGFRHEGLNSEISLHLLVKLIEANASSEELKEAWRQSYAGIWRRTPGFREFGSVGPE
jgi:sugar-specific transcriptional regulator TrmB